jgi:hypothetical protein
MRTATMLLNVFVLLRRQTLVVIIQIVLSLVQYFRIFRSFRRIASLTTLCFATGGSHLLRTASVALSCCRTPIAVLLLPGIEGCGVLVEVKSRFNLFLASSLGSRKSCSAAISGIISFVARSSIIQDDASCRKLDTRRRAGTGGPA